MKDYIKLLRVKHYIKNLLIFLPLFFSGALFHRDSMGKAIEGFICFCLLSSAVYILNDYRDIEKDKKHPTKCNRPLASGKIKPKNAIILMIFCLILVAVISLYIGNAIAALFLILYFVLNIAYSIGLKNVPIIDIVILSSGFVIRLLYGGCITEIEISKWLYLVVTTGSLYMGLGKRRNELKKHLGAREVLKYYNEAFLDKNMYVCVALTDVFYALWAVELEDRTVIWTVPFLIIILMCYGLDVEGNSDGDPVEVIWKDKILIGIILVYAMIIFFLMYVI